VSAPRRSAAALAPRLAGFACAAALLLPAPPARAAGARTDFEVRSGGGHADVPIVVEGRALAPLLGRPIPNLRLLGWRDGGWRPVPFQIDPRVLLRRPDRYDRLVHVLDGPDGADAGAARVLGPDDELVFLSGDAGPAPPASALPPSGSRGGALIGVAGAGAVALFAFDRPPPASPRRYVAYDPAHDRIDARAYTLGFSRAHPSVFDTLRIRPAPGVTGGAPDGPPNLVDTVKIRVRGRFLHAIPLRRTEADFQTERAGARAGPVRVVRGSRQRLALWLGIKSPLVEEEQIFYPDDFEFPIWFVKSSALNRVASRLSVSAGPDLSGAALGMRVRVAGDERAFLVDGRMDASERALSGENAPWSLIYGAPGAVLSRIAAFPVHASSGTQGAERDPKRLPAAPFRLTYLDDRARRDPPEREPGQIGALAWAFPDLAKLPPGEYHWTIRTRVMPRFAPGDERALLADLENPPAVRVTPLPAARQDPAAAPAPAR
jgi:hypothetical protein